MRKKLPEGQIVDMGHQKRFHGVWKSTESAVYVKRRWASISSTKAPTNFFSAISACQRASFRFEMVLPDSRWQTLSVIVVYLAFKRPSPKNPLFLHPASFSFVSFGSPRPIFHLVNHYGHSSQERKSSRLHNSAIKIMSEICSPYFWFFSC